MSVIMSKLDFYLRRKEDDLRLLSLCKGAIERGVRGVTVDYSQLDKAWKWLEHGKARLCARLDLTRELFTDGETFRDIKRAFADGAGAVEVARSPAVWNSTPDASEFCDIALEAAEGRPLVISLEPAQMDLPSFRNALRLLIAEGVKEIKLASGIDDRLATLSHLNAALEEAKGTGTKLIFTPATSEGKYALEDAFRLAEKLSPGEDILTVSLEWK